MKKMNKKAEETMLLETVLKVLVAVVCVGLLIFLGYQIYASFTADDALVKAKTAINELNSKINAFRSSDLTGMRVMIFPPEGWFLKSFNVLNEGHPANQCVGKYTGCLCVCGDFKCLELERVTCKGFAFSVIVNENLDESGVVPNPVLGGNPGVYNIKQANTIKLENLVELKIKKENGIIKINRNA